MRLQLKIVYEDWNDTNEKLDGEYLKCYTCGNICGGYDFIYDVKGRIKGLVDLLGENIKLDERER